MYLLHNVLKLLTSALAKKFLTKKRQPGGRGVTVHSDTLHHSTTVEKLAYASPEFSFRSCEDLAYETSCTEPESYLQRKRQFIVTTFNSMQWSIQAALIPRRPFWLRVPGGGPWARKYSLPWGGGGGLQYPQESPISTPLVVCYKIYRLIKLSPDWLIDPIFLWNSI